MKETQKIHTHLLSTKKTMETLKKLNSLPGVSGDEKEVRDTCIEIYKNYDLELISDRLGSIFGKKSGNSDLNVMISSNLDQIGLMISDIEKDGLLTFIPIGPVDMKLLEGEAVTLLSRTHNKSLGYVVKKNDKLFIDAGYTSKEMALENKVKIGNFAVLRPEFEILQDKFIVANNLSNRAGIKVGFDILENLKDETLEFNLFVGGITHSIIGQRAAITATTTINPDLALVIDASYSEETKPGLYVRNFDPSMLPNLLLKEDIENFAQKLGLETIAHFTKDHSDASFIHKSLSGTPTLVLVLPLKYASKHQNILEISHLKTLSDFITAYLKNLSKKQIRIMQYEKDARYDG